MTNEKNFNGQHFVTCTAIASACGDNEAQRTTAIFFYSDNEEEDGVIFGYQMPETEEDARNMFDDIANAGGYEFESDNLESIRFADGTTYEEWNHSFVR
jgi:hypothetical protein